MKAKLKQSTQLTSPRVTINVSDEDIEAALPKQSQHCMVKLAISRDVPAATHVLVDIQTIRWTDKTKGLRYTYLTPAKVIAIMLAWDEGYKPKPFSFRLRAAQVTSARPVVRSDGKKPTQVRAHKLGKRKRVIAPGDKNKRMRFTVIGGRPPPVTRFAYQGHRVFGSRTLANLVGGKDLVELLSGLEKIAPRS